ncbi:hypothetical protein ACEZCY_09855 [Streptacidiphilus sp. N1-12]|uniref:Uncharacterized protein n=2 Tax=Streptacidiphilus alkalitolerans TaxID=3342712 RepID=A0ABV6V748_9ACTN
MELTIAVLEELAATLCPDIRLLDCVNRCAGYSDQAHLFTGETVLHTDINPANTLICGYGAHFIDWAWPIRGASWVEPAIWVIRLIDAGHTPASAETWAGKLRTWDTAPAESLTAFAHVNAHMWDEIAEQAPQGSNWQKHMAASAHAWADHREEADRWT